MRLASVEDSVEAGADPGPKRIASSLFALIPELTIGLVRARRRSFWFGPLQLIEFGTPESVSGGWRWPVTGGLLAQEPGGWIELVWDGGPPPAGGGRLEGLEGSSPAPLRGDLVSRVEGYAPSLPWPLYAALQVPLHHLLMRSLLLRIRGRTPVPGVPAEPARRLLAAAVDVAVCGTVARAFARRRRLVTFAGIAAGYHIACWTLGGRTIGGLLTGERVVAVDGAPLTLGQALLRLAHLPRALLHLRALHDEAAGTEVVLTHPGGEAEGDGVAGFTPAG
jgi:hypothetical protein